MARSNGSLACPGIGRHRSWTLHFPRRGRSIAGTLGSEERMSRLVYGWLIAIFSGMPLGLGYFLADAFTDLHFGLFPSRRHAALANLAVMLPRSTRRERMAVARRMMRSYNRMLFEFFR